MGKGFLGFFPGRHDDRGQTISPKATVFLQWARDHGGAHQTYERFEDIVKGLLPTYPCVEQAKSPGGDWPIRRACFSAVVNDAAAFIEVAGRVVRSLNQRLPYADFSIIEIQVEEEKDGSSVFTHIRDGKVVSRSDPSSR